MHPATIALPLLWLVASGTAFVFVFKPYPRWPLVATPARAVAVFLASFLGGAVLVAVTRPKDEAPPPAPRLAPAARALPDPAQVRAHPERFVVLDRVTAFRNKAGDVLVTGGATNVSGLAIAEPRLSCQMAKGRAKAGTVSAVAPGTIPPGGKMIFAALNLGQAEGPWDRWTCQVAGARAS
ncbi:hypothetical protein [Caulobacter sp. BP25]|uniref:hypothetical protein n=1 Tax=Caulobacter sp. BP25 TaxID=2048900 RepID=UPI000C12C6E7|nr:hypothetical protein [Caulobacter sp. BP25]PHY18028.1 hypothetical protein CSW59_14670 [Caulobacter sp. BP25]